jgi:hypothetical protein
MSNKKTLRSTKDIPAADRVVDVSDNQPTDDTQDAVSTLQTTGLPKWLVNFGRKVSDTAVALSDRYLAADKDIELLPLPLGLDFATTMPKEFAEFPRVGSTASDATCLVPYLKATPTLNAKRKLTDRPDIYELPKKPSKSTGKRTSNRKATKGKGRGAEAKTRNRVQDFVELEHPTGIRLVAQISDLKKKLAPDNKMSVAARSKMASELSDRSKKLAKLVRLHAKGFKAIQTVHAINECPTIGIQFYCVSEKPTDNAYQLPAEVLEHDDKEPVWESGAWLDPTQANVIKLYDYTVGKKGTPKISGETSISVADLIKLNLDAIPETEAINVANLIATGEKEAKSGDTDNGADLDKAVADVDTFAENLAENVAYWIGDNPIVSDMLVLGTAKKTNDVVAFLDSASGLDASVDLLKLMQAARIYFNDVKRRDKAHNALQEQIAIRKREDTERAAKLARTDGPAVEQEEATA